MRCTIWGQIHCDPSKTGSKFSGWQIENHKSKRKWPFLHGPKKLLIVFDYCFWLFLCLSSKFSSRQNRKSKSMVNSKTVTLSTVTWPLPLPLIPLILLLVATGGCLSGCSSADIPPSQTAVLMGHMPFLLRCEPRILTIRQPFESSRRGDWFIRMRHLCIFL